MKQKEALERLQVEECVPLKVERMEDTGRVEAKKQHQEVAGWGRSSGPGVGTLEGRTTSCVWIEGKAEGRGQERAGGRS